MINFTPEERKMIVNAFKRGESRNSIAKEIKRDVSVVNRILKEEGIDYLDSQNKNGRKYYFNNQYFDNIDNENKAYWLGFLYADGYLSSGSPVIGITLKQEDLNHLKKFLNDLNCSSLDCIRYQEVSESYRFNLSDEYMYNVLKKLGFNSNKSYDNNTEVIDNIPVCYLKDFIRGLWDGDGYITKSKEKRNLAGIVSNNEKMILKIVDFFNKKVNKKDFCRLTKSDGYPRIRLSYNKAKEAMDILYKNSSIYLDRKFNNYLSLNEPFLKSKQYKGIKKLNSGRYYIRIRHNNKYETVGTFDTVKEAIEEYNKKAREYGLEAQTYIDENLNKEC